jgi:hypothetical protein
VVAILLGVQLVGFVVVEGFAGRNTHVSTPVSLLQRCRNPTISRHPFINRDRCFKPSMKSSLRMEMSSSSDPANDDVVVRSSWGSHRRRTCEWIS